MESRIIVVSDLPTLQQIINIINSITDHALDESKQSDEPRQLDKSESWDELCKSNIANRPILFEPYQPDTNDESVMFSESHTIPTKNNLQHSSKSVNKFLPTRWCDSNYRLNIVAEYIRRLSNDKFSVGQIKKILLDTHLVVVGHAFVFRPVIDTDNKKEISQIVNELPLRYLLLSHLNNSNDWAQSLVGYLDINDDRYFTGTFYEYTNDMLERVKSIYDLLDELIELNYKNVLRLASILPHNEACDISTVDIYKKITMHYGNVFNISCAKQDGKWHYNVDINDIPIPVCLLARYNKLVIYTGQHSNQIIKIKYDNKQVIPVNYSAEKNTYNADFSSSWLINPRIESDLRIRTANLQLITHSSYDLRCTDRYLNILNRYVLTDAEKERMDKDPALKDMIMELKTILYPRIAHIKYDSRQNLTNAAQYNLVTGDDKYCNSTTANQTTKQTKHDATAEHADEKIHTNIAVRPVLPGLSINIISDTPLNIAEIQIYLYYDLFELSSSRHKMLFYEKLYGVHSDEEIKRRIQKIKRTEYLKKLIRDQEAKNNTTQQHVLMAVTTTGFYDLKAQADFPDEFPELCKLSMDELQNLLTDEIYDTSTYGT